MSERIEMIKKAVEQDVGGRAQHIVSTPVREVFRGETAWEGIVETFDISLNPKVKRCYGLMYRDGDETRYASIAATDDINSPELAVKAFIASQIEK